MVELVLIVLLAVDGILTLIMLIWTEIGIRRLKKKQRVQEEKLISAEHMQEAAWNVCISCDKSVSDKCIGYFKCPEIAKWIEDKKVELRVMVKDGNGGDDNEEDDLR